MSENGNEIPKGTQAEQHELRQQLLKGLIVSARDAGLGTDDPTCISGIVLDLATSLCADAELARLRERLAADLAGFKRIQEMSRRFVHLDDLPVLLNEVIAAAMDLTGAQKGTIQQLDQKTGEMRIVAQRGFEQPVPMCSKCIEASTGGVCGRGLHCGQRVVVEDVSRSPELAGTVVREILLGAGVLGMLCTPLNCHVGRHLGLLSLHFTAPHRADERELGLLDVLTRQAADFVERTQAELLLHETRNQLRLALETAQLGTYERDLTTNEITVNSVCREILGWSVSILPPDVAYRSVHPEDKDRVLATVTRAFDPALREVCAAEFRIIQPGGAMRWVAGRGRVIFDESVNPPRPCKFLGVLNDITARKIAEEQVVRARDELSRANDDLERRVRERTTELSYTIAELEQMSYSMIHDLRAPLRAIRSFGGIVAEDPGNTLTEESRELIGKMRAATERMDHLVRDMLNYSRVVREELPLSSVDVGALARGIVETYPSVQASRAQVCISPKLPCVTGNPAALTQCFSQLLDNAVKFAKGGQVPAIEIRGERREGGWVRIEVEDQGIGIAPEVLGKVFGIYRRLSNVGEGTGMGLAIVKKGVERMGGHVGAESTPGEGSRFWIELKEG